jgi:DNA-directed RNA polymerase subunit H (RpoH/RPB5)
MKKIEFKIKYISITMDITVTQVYLSRTNLLEILKDQGYNVSNYDHYSLSMIGSMMENKRLDLQLTHTSGKQVFIKYHLDTKLVIPTVTCSLFDEVDGEPPILKKTDDLIIITKSDPNDTMIADMNKLWNDSSIYVSVINIKRLQFNILKHAIVPKHVVLSDEEKTQLFQKYHIQSNADLPTITRYDPVAQVLCMRPGMVCCIERKSKTAVTTLYYRVCV